MSVVPWLRGRPPLVSVVKLKLPYGAVTWYVDFGQRPPVRISRTRPKTIWSPNFGAPLTNAPSRLLRIEIRPAFAPLQPGVASRSDWALRYKHSEGKSVLST